MIYDLYLVKSGEKWFGYTRDILEESGYKAVDGSIRTSEYGTLNREDFTKEGATVSGVWCVIEPKQQWLEGDNTLVETKITDQVSPFIRHGELWEAAIVEAGVTSWNLDVAEPKFTKTLAGLAAMPLKLSKLVKAIVVTDLLDDPEDPLK